MSKFYTATARCLKPFPPMGLNVGDEIPVSYVGLNSSVYNMDNGVSLLDHDIFWEHFTLDEDSAEEISNQLTELEVNVNNFLPSYFKFLKERRFNESIAFADKVTVDATALYVMSVNMVSPFDFQNGTEEEFVAHFAIIQKFDILSDGDKKPNEKQREFVKFEVTSSNMDAVSFNEDYQQAIVDFKGGTSYLYHDVAREQIDEMLEAESVGSHFNKVFKPAHPNFEKIEA